MPRCVSIALSIAAFSLLSGCARLDPELPSGDEQQLDRPATLGGGGRGTPLEAPDEAAVPYVPGQ